MRCGRFKAWVLLAAFIATLHPSVAAADSVGPYGVNRINMISSTAETDGRPLTFSESDIFACVQFPSEAARIYRVPYGYATDQTSVPRRAIVLVVGDQGFNSMYANAAIVHDYLYAVGDTSPTETWANADKVMTTLLIGEEVDGAVARIIGLAFDFNRARDRAARVQLEKKIFVGIGGMIGWFMANRFSDRLKAWLTNQQGAFGKEREWRRWANPYTLEPLSDVYNDNASLPPARLALAPSSCAVFDDRTHPSHQLLHACLHARFSTGNRQPVPVRRGQQIVNVPWPAPRVPRPLEQDVANLPPDVDCQALAG